MNTTCNSASRELNERIIMSKHPFLEKDFEVKWSELTADHIEKDIREGIRLAEQRLTALRSVKHDEVTFENTFLALESAGEELGRGWSRLQHLDSVNDHEEQRKGLNVMLPEVSAFYSNIALDAEIYGVLRAFAESDRVESLNVVQRRYVEETMADFRDNGAELAEGKKQRVAEIASELSALTQKYSENVLDSTNAYELIVDDEVELAGLPEMAKEAARIDALEKGYGSEDEPKWRFTLQYPSMGPVMQYAESDALRKKIWEATGTIGHGEWDNTELVWKILELRQEKAEILGKKHFSDMILDRRMAKSGEEALAFVDDLHAKVSGQFRDEMASLREYANAKRTKQGLLEPWETSYWAELRRKEEYDFDEEELRPYFAVETVMKGMFDITSKLFGIRIEEKENEHVWTEDMQFYEMFDARSGELLGSFYADWHPRAEKRGGAWMNGLQTGMPARIRSHEDQPHLGVICGNMTKPVGDKPALLDHREVETIFHEFGHLLHHLLGDSEIRSLSGTNVPWDFVELPSQIMENFCWERETLDLFARHYETGKPIPEELFQKMVAAKNYMSATMFMRQLSLGKLDLELHMHLDRYHGKALAEVERVILEDFRAKLATPVKGVVCRLTHLFCDPVAYASGYYSYKWAEVLDADAFTRFKNEGLLNAEVGHAFRKEILSMGNTRPVDESYRAFMGRDPELSPLLERSGIRGA